VPEGSQVSVKKSCVNLARDMTAKELVSLLESAGWSKDRQKGSHALFKHPRRNGRITVPMHAGDLPKGTLNDILKKAGLKK